MHPWHVVVNKLIELPVRVDLRRSSACPGVGAATALSLTFGSPRGENAILGQDSVAGDRRDLPPGACFLQHLVGFLAGPFRFYSILVA